MTNYTDQLFSPYDSDKQQSSLFFLLQSGSTNEKKFKTIFSSYSPIEYETFDFYEDSGPQDDGDNFIAKVQRVDIELLENLKHKYSRRAKKLDGKLNMFGTCVLYSMTGTILMVDMLQVLTL